MKMEWREQETLFQFPSLAAFIVGKLSSLFPDFRRNHTIASLGIFFIVVVTYHRNKSLEPWELVEILHGIYIGVCTAGWGLVRLMVTQTKTSSKEPLDQCQLWSFLVWVCIHNHRDGIKSLPCPLFWFLHWVSEIFRVFFIPKGTLTALLPIPIFRTTWITKLMPTPGYQRVIM